MENSKSFALLPPYKKTDRTYMIYSDALFTEQVYIFCNEKVMTSKERKKFPEDFQGLTFGINQGFALAPSLKKAKEAGQITIDEAKGNDFNIKKAIAGRVDCYVNDKVSIVTTLRNLQSKKEVDPNSKLLGAVLLSTEDAFLGYNTNGQTNFSFQKDFQTKFNSALAALKADKSIEKITKQYLE